MKKGLKVVSIGVGALLLLMILVPLLFKGKIKEVIVKQGNEMLNADLNFSSVSLNLFNNFPNLCASIDGLSIVGRDKFEGDTLLSVGRAKLAFNLASLFSSEGYQVKSIELNNTVMHAIVLEDSSVNWDIMKPDTVVSEEQGEAAQFKVNLKKMTVKDLSVSYDDRAGKTFASFSNFDATISGDMSASQTAMKIEILAEQLEFKSSGVSYLSKGKLYADIDLDADMEKSIFTLKDNVIRLNAIEAKIDGWLALTEKGMDMDMKFSTPEIGFKEILSLVPAIYSKDFESIKATGEVSLLGWVKGKYEGEQLPAFDLKIAVDNGTFRYPSLPKGVDGIKIAAQISNPGGTADNTEVNINPMSFTMAGNPFSLVAAVRTPVSDAAFEASAKGMINLGMVKEVYPLEDMELNGVVVADVSVAGRMSDIEAQRYEKVSARGTVTLGDLLLKSKDSKDVRIEKSTLTFSPQYLDLSQTTLHIGGNDLSLDCKVENYIGYVLKDNTLKGTMNLRSSYLNINEMMGSEGEQTTADISSLSVIEVPKNVDLAIKANLAKVVYDKLTIEQINGNLAVKDGTLDMSNLSMNTLGGNVVMNGKYSTAESLTTPNFGASFAMKGLSFTETFSSFVTIQKIAPLFENINGNYSGSLNLNTLLDSEMTPVLNTLSGAGSLSTKDIGLSDVGIISTIADLANISGMKDRKVKDLNVNFTIQEGKITTKPFDINLGETSLNLSGTTSLDQTIDYVGKVSLPEAAAALTRASSVNLKIGGTFAKPQVSIDTKDLATQVIQGAVNSAIQDLGSKVGIDLSDAQKQKDALIETAKKGGEVIMSQAQQQAEEITKKAGKDPISQAAVKKIADKVILQAQRNVDEMVSKAQAKGDSIIEKAKLGSK